MPLAASSAILAATTYGLQLFDSTVSSGKTGGENDERQVQQTLLRRVFNRPESDALDAAARLSWPEGGRKR